MLLVIFSAQALPECIIYNVHSPFPDTGHNQLLRRKVKDTSRGTNQKKKSLLHHQELKGFSCFLSDVAAFRFKDHSCNKSGCSCYPYKHAIISESFQTLNSISSSTQLNIYIYISHIYLCFMVYVISSSLSFHIERELKQ